MQFARTVDAQTDEKPIVLKKCSPPLIQQNAICLQVVFNALARLCVLFLKRDDLMEKIKTP